MYVFDGNTIDPAFTLFQAAKENKFVFSYRGPFNAELTSKFVGISEQSLSKNSLRKVNRRFSFLLVETFQNILKHGKEIESNMHGHFSFRNSDDNLFINSINLICNNQIDSLVEKVNQVNEMDPEELKTIWKNQLLEGEFSDKGGAGLGMIEIARRSGQKMLYRLDNFDDKHTKFHQQVAYLNNQSNKTTIPDFIEQTIEVNGKMKLCDILFEYKGGIQQKMIFPMMKIVENSVVNSIVLKKKIKTAIHILMEMLQNIPTYHNGDRLEKDGVCVIQKLDNKFVINTGNIINTSQKEFLTKRLEQLKEMTVNELKVLHYNRMTEVINSDEKSSSELGLIEIVRYAQGDFWYSFYDIGNGQSFFSLKVSV